MKPIRYTTGDATAPQTDGEAIVCHVCNDIGGWGRGFVLALSAKWEAPEAGFREWHRHRNENDYGLGAVLFVPVEESLWVANMVAQRDIVSGPEGPPIRYEAVDTCIQKVAAFAADRGASVHMPRIGCGLAGGSWDRIEPILVKHLCTRDVDVTVYDYDPATSR